MRRRMPYFSPMRYICLVMVFDMLTASANAAHPRHAVPQELPGHAVAETSLYQVTSTWITATEQHIRLGVLQGKVQVLAMFSTTCEYACPLLVSMMQQMEAALPAELLSQVGFVLITIDPAHDTPRILRTYRDKRHLDSQRWTLLYGQPDEVLELAVLLGVNDTKDPQGGFAHTNLVTVLNKQGEIVHRHEGVQARIEDTLAAIRHAVQD
jgi:protein SCO1/2